MIFTDRAEYIWHWLWERIGNEFGVAGLMGNLCAESALNPENLQNSYEKALGMTDHEYVEAVDNLTYQKDFFIADKAGFGIAQWSYWSRKRGLYEYAEETGRSIGDLEMQLEYLIIEMARDYKDVFATLVNASSVREASDAVLLKYEKPANQTESNCEARAAIGQRYYDQYAVRDEMNEKAETVVRLAKERLGCPYKWGALGQEIDGRQTFDCRGFTWWLLHQVGIEISQTGATTQYNTARDWTERGQVRDMPNLVCPVFMYNEADNKMSHTGMHIGNGVIIHCTENGGVKYGSLSDRGWTHYAIPKGLYSPDEIEKARDKAIMRTLRIGSSGADVLELQKTLTALGYDCGKPDGIFGSRTALAVKMFQANHGLTADGVVGALTWAALQGGGDAPEKPELPDRIQIPLDMAMSLYRALGEQLGMAEHASSADNKNNDYH